MALSSDGSVVAVGIDSYDGEDRGLVRVFGWSCDPGAGGYVQMGQDLLGGEEFDGFGQSVDLSADGLTLVVGANQPPPGKSGYVEVYAYNPGGDGLWKLVGHRIDNVPDTVGDIGREVQVSDDGVIVSFSGSVLVTGDEGYTYVSSFMRSVHNVDGEWKPRGSDILSSIAYDDYGSEMHIAQSGDGKTLAVCGSYSQFLAKVYRYDDEIDDWAEYAIPPIVTTNGNIEFVTDADDSDDYDYAY